MSETLIKNAQIWQWRGDSDGGFYASWMLIRDGTIKQLGRGIACADDLTHGYENI